MMPAAVISSFALAAAPAFALDEGDLSNMTSIFDAQCLEPLMAGQEPSTRGFRQIEGEGALGYSGSLTQDDRIILSADKTRGLWDCGTQNSVYTAPADSADAKTAMVAALDAYAERLSADEAFVEITSCYQEWPGSGVKARAFVTKSEARSGTYLNIVTSAALAYANGGVSLQEHYGVPSQKCEAVQ